MDLVHIATPRQGVNGDNQEVASYSDFDEPTANPDSELSRNTPSLKNGTKVRNSKRRPEIVEEFDRETYGRVPSGDRAAKW